METSNFIFIKLTDRKKKFYQLTTIQETFPRISRDPFNRELISCWSVLMCRKVCEKLKFVKRHE